MAAILDGAEILAGMLALLLLADLYFLPSLIAWLRHHPQRGTIFAFNLLLGWTLAGWGFTLFWALPAQSAEAGTAWLLRGAQRPLPAR